MDRNAFFEQLHLSLAKKYGVPVEAISYIRGGMREHLRDKQELIGYIEKHLASREQAIHAINKHYLTKTHKRRCKEFQCVSLHEELRTNTLKKIQFRQSLIYFLKAITEEQWQEITQKTQYDKV